MVRILLFIGLMCLIYWVFTRLIAYYKSSQNKATRDSEAQSAQHKSTLKIVQCSRCGLHVPENESHLQNERIVCNNNDCNESN